MNMLIQLETRVVRLIIRLPDEPKGMSPFILMAFSPTLAVFPFLEERPSRPPARPPALVLPPTRQRMNPCPFGCKKEIPESFRARDAFSVFDGGQGENSRARGELKGWYCFHEFVCWGRSVTSLSRGCLPFWA